MTGKNEIQSDSVSLHTQYAFLTTLLSYLEMLDPIMPYNWLIS